MSEMTGDSIYQWLLQKEDSDSDDQRFYASYLIGHSSLALADAESLDLFYLLMNQNLEAALAVDKLSDSDKTGINSLWQEACQHNIP